MAQTEMMTAKQAVTDYFHALPPEDLHVMVRQAAFLEDNANHAFAKRADDGIVVVPALITQETTMESTLDIIRGQNANVAVAVSANMPLGGSDMEGALNNVEILQEYQLAYPDFPLSYYLAGYSPGTPIGRIVYELYGAAILHGFEADGRRPRNRVITRCDLDLVNADAGYLPDTLSIFSSGKANVISYPTVLHDRLDENKYPNLNRLIGWTDKCALVDRTMVSAHFSTDTVGYAAAKGVDPSCTLSECNNVLGRMASTHAMQPLSVERVDHRVTVSCRHLARLALDSGYMIYTSLRMPDDSAKTHRNSGEPPHDLPDTEYRRQVGWHVMYTLHAYGDRIYEGLVAQGESTAASIRTTQAAMADYGMRSIQELGDPDTTQRVVDGAIGSWVHDGPPAGYVSRRLPKWSLRLPPHALEWLQTADL